MSRPADLTRLYALLDRLEVSLGGKRRLVDCNGRLGWPQRGVYFFFEPGEVRSDTGTGPRVVRVGTHALTTGSRATLWQRLSQHRGSNRTGGGNHRGSIFRLLVGTAIKGRDGLTEPISWGRKAGRARAAEELERSLAVLRRQEAVLEAAATTYIGQMFVLWVGIDDPSDFNSDRGQIERNAIALLSNLGKAPVDPSSAGWLGQYCDRELVRRSGLWNNNHVAEPYDATFLKTLDQHVVKARPIAAT